MKKNKRYLGLLIAVMLVVIGYVSYKMLNIGKEEPSYSVSVIVDNSSSDRWNAFKEGLDQGADGSRIFLNVVSTTEFSSLAEEITIIRRELENGADGIIVELCDSEDESGQFAEAIENQPVVLVENDLSLSNMYSIVMPDHYALGEAVAEAILKQEGPQLEGIKIGILAGDQNLISLSRRLEGFQDAIRDSHAEIVWSILEETSMNAQLLQDYMKKEPVDIIVALDNDETEKAVDYLLENPRVSYKIYGEGRSEKAVYYLDKGLIEMLVVPNEYYMGYQSMEIMSEKLNQLVVLPEEVTVDFLSVTKDTMYDENNVQILFPTIR